jgi:hypothetical protein
MVTLSGPPTPITASHSSNTARPSSCRRGTPSSTPAGTGEGPACVLPGRDLRGVSAPSRLIFGLPDVLAPIAMQQVRRRVGVQRECDNGRSCWEQPRSACQEVAVNRLAHTVARRRSYRPEDPLLSPLAPIFSDDGHGRPRRRTADRSPISLHAARDHHVAAAGRPGQNAEHATTHEMGLRPTSFVEIRANGVSKRSSLTSTRDLGRGA